MESFSSSACSRAARENPALETPDALGPTARARLGHPGRVRSPLKPRGVTQRAADNLWRAVADGGVRTPRPTLRAGEPAFISTRWPRQGGRERTRLACCFPRPRGKLWRLAGGPAFGTADASGPTARARLAAPGAGALPVEAVRCHAARRLRPSADGVPPSPGGRGLG